MSSLLSSSSSKKRKKSSGGANIFSAISQLESEDVKASKVRRTLNEKGIAQSKAAQSQANLQSQLVECRILLQQVLQQSSSVVLQQQQGPESDNDNDSDDNDNNNNDDKLKQKCISSCDDIMSYLLDARRKLCNNDNDDDSDDDDGDTNHYSSIVKEKDGSLEDLMQTEYQKCQEDWKEVLNRRHADLQLSAGLKTKAGSGGPSKQFRVMDQSFWDQWTEYLQSQQRWTPTTNDSDTDTGLAAVWYDDSKLYQYMLKDFIAQQQSSNTTATSMAEAAAKRLARKQRKRQKNASSQRLVDRKASKGRKIRYVVHDKLVHFTFPINRPIPTIPENDWFRSLFGGIAKKSF